MRVLYFASIAERVDLRSEMLTLPVGVESVEMLRQYLARRGDAWLVFQDCKNLRCALNQTTCGFDAVLKDSDEVAFFPPVTGG